MTGPDDLRRRLRDADPAAGADLTPTELARMRHAVIRAAIERRGASAPPWALRLAAALAVVAVTVLAARGFLSRRQAPTEAVSVLPARAPTPAPVPVQNVVDPHAPDPARSGAFVTRTRRHRPPSPAMTVQPASTRIEFVAPQGTRIIWLPQSSPTQEVKS